MLLHPECIPHLQKKQAILKCSLGKDSMGVFLAMKEANLEPSFVVVNDTGWENDLWYDWLDYIKHHVIKDLMIVRAEVEPKPGLQEYVDEIESMLGRYSPMIRLILNHAMFPHRMMKFCTRELKVDPTYDLDWIDNRHHCMVTGIRWQESRRRAAMPSVEKGPSKPSFWELRPIIHWGLDDVLNIHKRFNLKLCPVYELGVDRVGCWPCMPARSKVELAALAKDEKRIRVIERLEEIVTQLAAERRQRQAVEAMFNGDEELFKKLLQLEPPTAMNISLPGNNGIASCVSIRDAIRWGQSKHGGDPDLQMSMFSFTDTCSRWGFCDVGNDNDFAC